MANIFDYQPHPRAEELKANQPVKTVDMREIDHPNLVVRFNARLGLAITTGVGTMWTAYLFTLLALVSLPSVLSGVFPSIKSAFPSWLISLSLIALVAWVAQTFLQLVLLPIIIVGQNVQSKSADKRAEDTYKDAEAVLKEAAQIQEHLAAQDQIITDIVAKLEALTTKLP